MITNPIDVQQPLDFLLIGGVPLNKPVVRYGPFVMNTKAEIMQAIEDYQNGEMILLISMTQLCNVILM
ncbi:pirin-like C-terminal cupin domain-containing protein [Floridanema evergladense]|uniref:Pirin-like C-terminal cupin domain-containing protein n=1 Tax=Floridaenema evergladense BLCC-F167 TaxID=3153639 RepID=A0ABV4WTQ7_9CYAN